LFQQLHDAPDELAARQIEQRIWAIWVAHEDAEVSGLMEIGMGQMAHRNYPSALETFEEMVSLAPDFAEAWNKRATVHWLMGNNPLSGRGLVYVNLEEWELALKAFDDALAVYPQMIGPRLNGDAIRMMLEGQPI
jgi:tetratricopeptide (TPR) repeat protein